MTTWLRHQCKDVSRLISQAQDERLPLVARLRVRLHLSLCAMCSRFQAQLEFLREAARRYKA